MNPDNHDANSHAPPVSPGDDWGDLDKVSSPQQMGLPPRRMERGIPTMREPIYSSIRRRSPNFDPSDDGGPESAEPLSEGSAGARPAATEAPETPPARNTEQLTPSLITKITVDADLSGFPANDAVAGDAFGVNPQEERVARPGAMLYGGNKHFRVNEIKAQRPDDRWVSKTPPKISKRAGKRVSNEALMHGGQPDSENAGAADRKSFSLSFLWMVSAGAGVTLIVVAAILLNRPSQGVSELGKQSFFGNIKPDRIYQEGEFKGGQALDSLINGEVRAKGIFAVYATSKSVENFIGTVYKAEKNGEMIAGRWKPLGMVAGWKPDDNCTWVVMEEGGIKFGVLSGFLSDSSGFRAVFRLEGDSMKMDWKASTGYCSADYPELKRGLGDGREIRAILSPGDFHTYVLSEDVYRCYALQAPDRKEKVWGYTKLNGANDVMLYSQFLPSELTGEMLGEMPMLLVLERGRAESLPNQWMISKVVRLNWLDE